MGAWFSWPWPASNTAKEKKKKKSKFHFFNFKKAGAEPDSETESESETALELEVETAAESETGFELEVETAAESETGFEAVEGVAETVEAVAGVGETGVEAMDTVPVEVESEMETTMDGDSTPPGCVEEKEEVDQEVLENPSGGPAQEQLRQVIDPPPPVKSREGLYWADTPHADYRSFIEEINSDSENIKCYYLTPGVGTPANIDHPPDPDAAKRYAKAMKVERKAQRRCSKRKKSRH